MVVACVCYWLYEDEWNGLGWSNGGQMVVIGYMKMIGMDWSGQMVVIGCMKMIGMD